MRNQKRLLFCLGIEDLYYPKVPIIATAQTPCYTSVVTKKSISYLLAGLLLLQPGIGFGADKDSGSFFHRNRKTEDEKKVVKQEEAPTQAAVGSTQVSTDADAEKIKLELPPADPADILATLLPKSPPAAPQDIPSPPDIPGAPKCAPKPPSIPKIK